MPTEPYRKLFGLALLCGIAGVLLWPLYLGGWIPYPLLSHSHLMFLGFFLGFVSGFLMTALPRMSGTAPATRSESNAALTLILSSGVAAVAGWNGVAYALSAAQFLNLSVFAARRIRAKKQKPPVGFMFVPAGLLWGMVGSLASATPFFQAGTVPVLHQLGKVGVQQAFLLNLIVGLGSRLIPFLTRVEKIDPTQVKAEDWRPAILTLVLLNLTFVAELYSYSGMVYALRSAVLLFVSVTMFSILEKPIERTVLGWGIRLSVWAVIAGYGLLALIPGLHLGLLHVIFIAGFSLLTMLVATRVVLSHGNQPLTLEKKSPYLGAAVCLFVAAACTRGLSWLPAAAWLWIVAQILWFIGIGRFLKGTTNDFV